MIADPQRRGRALAELHRRLAPSLYADLEGAGLLADDPGLRRRAAEEWECLALYAGVRGLIAAGGFNRETGIAIDAFHAALLGEPAPPGADVPARDAERRGRIAARYGEYGAIGLEGGKAGAATVAARIGRAAARHIADAEPDERLAELVGALHESLAEGAAESVRSAG